jgi:Hypothetical protein (DUF2513)
MALIRAILFELESHKHGFAPSKLEIPTYSAEEVGFHVHLLGQAKLLETEDITTHGDKSPNALPLGITWDGYDFLEAARNEVIWKKATDTLTHSGVGVTLEILKALLIDFGKKAVGLP